MQKFSYTITLTEESEAKAISKMKGLVDLASHLQAHEVAKLAEVVKNDPAKTALAKSALGL